MTTTTRDPMDEIKAEGFTLLAAPACSNFKRHRWTPLSRGMSFCSCGVRRAEVWGGRSPRRSAGGMCRVRFAAAAPRCECGIWYVPSKENPGFFAANCMCDYDGDEWASHDVYGRRDREDFHADI